jgi:hypothetical protein
MARRWKMLCMLAGFGLLHFASGCGGQADEEASREETARDRTTSALASPAGFQQGVSPSTSYAGASDSTRKHTNALLRFDVGAIAYGSKVTSVSLTVNVTNRTSGSGYALFALARAWSEGQATWQAAATGSDWGSPGAAGPSDRTSEPLASLTPTTTGKVTVTLNAAGVAAVQSWVDDPALNFGFVMDTADNADGLGFDASNAPVTANRPRLDVTFDPPRPVSPYPIYTAAEVEAWSTTNPEYTRLAGSWAANVNRTYAPYGTEVSSIERDVLKDEAVYIKTQAVLWAADGNVARKDKVIELLNDLRSIQTWQWDSVEQYRLVAGWVTTNIAQAAAIVGYRDPELTRFLVNVNYPLMDWPGASNWQASFADSKLAVAVYVNDPLLYADAKAYFYKRLPQSIYHSAYDGNKVAPCLASSGAPSPSATILAWGGNWGAAQVRPDFTFVDPSYVTDGFSSETIRDLGHVSMGLGAWANAARTILAHGDGLEKHAYDRLRAGYVVHARRVLAYKNTGTTPAPLTVRGHGGGAMNQGWLPAQRLFGADTPTDVITLLGHSDVRSSPAAGANHLVAESFADGP